MNLTFLNGAFLFAALAALLPLVIHLISRRKVVTVEFSSLRFLKELERKRIRRVRLRQILLLVIRSLIILAVALALARPTLRGAVVGAGSHARTSVAVIVDNSASMSRSRDGGDLLEQALSTALEIGELLEEGDQAFLITAGTPASSVLPGGTFSPDALIEALESVKPSASSTEYASAVAMAKELLTGARNLNREIYLIGDMQRRGWEPAGSPGGRVLSAPDDGTGSDSVEAPTSPGDGPRAYVRPLTGPVTNLSVSSVEVQRRHSGGSSFSIAARVSNHGRRENEAILRLVVDGEQSGQAGVTVPPGGSATARFVIDVDDSDWHAGAIILPEDALELDNSHHFVIPAARRTEVLVVRPSDTDELDDADYITNALDPTSSGERFAVSVVTADELARQSFGRFPVAILADVGRLDPEGESWLSRHTAGGGGLLIVLGNRTDVRSWNGGAMADITGSEIVSPIERRSGVRLAPAAQDHPMLEGLVVGERLIDDINARRAFGVRAESAEVVLELPGLGPALFLARSGAIQRSNPTAAEGARPGEVAVLATAVDPEWNDLARSGFVVPLMHRLAERLSRSNASAASAVVGEDLVVALAEVPRSRVEVESPGGRTSTAEVRSGAAPAAVVPDASEPGVYRFQESGRSVALGAVNVAPRESDLTPLDDGEVAERLSDMPVTFIDPETPLAREVLQSRYGRELWRAMLYAALALVALEMFIARPRFASTGTRE